MVIRRTPTKLQGKPWRGPVEREPDRHPHHVSRLISILEVALNPNSTIEKRLWAACTLRRCVETSDDRGQRLIRENTVVPSSLVFLIRTADESDTGARIKEHALLTLLHLLGNDDAYDELVFYDEAVQEAVRVSLTDPHVVVAGAAIQVVRRVTECAAIAHWILYNDALFNQLLELLEVCDDHRIVIHAMNSLLNLSSNERVHFALARCSRLLQLLMETVYQADSEPGRAEIAVKTLANLLSFPDNVSEVLRLVPSLVNTMIDTCQSKQLELAAASRHVLECVHDGDLPRIEAAVSNEFVEGRAMASRLRSPILSNSWRSPSSASKLSGRHGGDHSPLAETPSALDRLLAS